METITLNVGVCSYLKDWHGKFDGHKFTAEGSNFVFREKIIEDDGLLQGCHFWVDRHYVKYHFLDHHTFDTFVTLYEYHTAYLHRQDRTRYLCPFSDIWWRSKRKPSFKRLLQAMERFVEKAQKLHGLQEWWSENSTVRHVSD